jgi:hypothetical protein
LHRAAGFQFSEGKMKRLFFCVFLLALAACSAQPSQNSIQTAIAQTQAANPTMTETATIIPTITPTPTNTRIPPTLIPSKTPTLTPNPVTQTALVVGATQTTVAFRATLTRSAFQALMTSTAAQATKIASYTEIYWKELVTYPENHKGEKIRVRVQIYNPSVCFRNV